MKKKLLALLLVLLMIPAVSVLAAQTYRADSLMEDTYAVIGGEQRITIRSHVETGGRGGYCQAGYAWELTGRESKAELDAIAVELVESGAEPVWGGSKPCFHGGAYATDLAYAMKASKYEPGSYLYVCYSFLCEGGNHNHYPVPSYEHISTMSVRVTEQAQGLELGYALVNDRGERTDEVQAGGELELDLDGGTVTLALLCEVEYPVERILGIRADFDKNQAVDPFVFDEESMTLEPVCCGSGSITVTIGNYLDDTTRTETVFLTVPCVPEAERTMVLEPTCTEEGLAARCCRGYGVNCETIFDEIIVDATGHTLWEVEEYLVEPTATLPGIGLGRCCVCDMEGAEQELPPIFCDVTSNSFYSVPLDYCYDMGWVSGVTFNAFAPNQACVRAQVVTFLWRAAGKPEPVGKENPFKDVKKGDFYYDAVLWAVENGITTGTDPDHFSPHGVCNRAQVVTFLWRAFGQPEAKGEEHPFTDVKAKSWYEQPVLWAVEEGITSGLTAATFGPTASCNRAQIVTFLYRAYAE